MSLYIKTLTLPSEDEELRFIMGQRLTCYFGVYPYKIFPAKELRSVEFAPITVFYGGNGSGKTTLLNVLAQKAGVPRHSAFAGGPFFETYTAACRLKAAALPPGSQLLASDDVFDYLLDLRSLNNGIDTRRDELLGEYTRRKYTSHRLSSLQEYDDWKRSADAKSKSKSRFVKDQIPPDAALRSNGESALSYFVQRMEEAQALYLLDEPENSLSVALQLELRDYLLATARLSGQLVLATHSPVLLSMPGARIYDLDAVPARVRRWTQLENVRRFYRFFREHAAAFEAEDPDCAP